MRELNWATRAYVGAIWLGGGLVVALVYPAMPPVPAKTWLIAAALSLLHFWLTRMELRLPSGATFNPASLVTTSVLISSGPGPALLTVGLSRLLNTDRDLTRRLFYSANISLALLPAWLVLKATQRWLGVTDLSHPLPGIAAVATYLCVSAVMVSVMIRLTSGVRFWAAFCATLPLRLTIWPGLGVLTAAIGERSQVTGLVVLMLVGAAAYLSGREEKRIRAQAEQDALTGLYNHLYLHRRLGELVEETAHTGTPLALVMLDIRGFKAFNDRYGHAAGDRVLVELGRMLSARVPWPSVAARYGGDELAVVLVGTHAASAEEFCRSLAADMARLPGPVPSGCDWGVARAEPGVQGKNELLALAAERLYQAQNLERTRKEESMRRVERLSALGQLAAGIAHEIKNPLTAVRGFLQLHGHRLDPEVLATIMDELGRIDSLTAEFLTLARPSRPEVVPLSADDLIAMSARLGQVLASQYEGTLRIAAGQNLPAAMADPERCRQVLLNLLKNAFEAAPGGAVTVEAGVAENHLWLAIQDDGPGVPPELRETIFDPFFTTKPAGTGLGLTVSHQMVHDMGGQLELAPHTGGARFVLRLPLAD